MMRSLRCLLVRISRMLVVLAVLVPVVTSARGQLNFLSRYHQDQAHRYVRLPPTSVKGLVKDGKLHLSEKQAIEMALHYNLGVNVQRVQYLYDGWTARSEEGIYDPSGSFGLDWSRRRTPTTSVLAGGTQLTDVLTTYNLGYQQLWSTGTSLNVTFTGSRDRTTNLFASLIPAINTSFEVMVSQDLLQGFGRVLPDYQIEISRNNLKVSLQQFRSLAAQTILQVQNQYWELAYALEDIRVKQKSLESANTLLQQNRDRLEVGTASRLDVTQAEAQVALFRGQLIASQYNYRLAQDQLVTTITDYQDPRQFTQEIVPADSVYSPPPVTEAFQQLQATAYQQRPELQQADLQLENSRVTLTQSRNRLRPSLNLQVGYQQFGLGGTEIVRDYSQGIFNAPIIAIVPGGLGQSLHQLFSGTYYGYVVQANLQFPIFNTEARALSAQAQIDLNRNELSKANLEQSVALEIRQALTQIEQSRASLAAAVPGVTAAQAALAGEEAKFEAGLATTRDIIDAQRDLLTAEEVRVRAQIDLIEAYAALDHAVGQTFERHSIRLMEAIETNVH
ncbi:MAG: TolC family protein [Acidobacteriota bacterium]